MKQFRVYQNPTVMMNHNEINRIGNMDQAIQEIPGYKAHLDCSMSGSRKFKPEYAAFYQPVCTIESKDMDQVFEALNGFDNGSQITRHKRMHSLSVGDVIVDLETTQAYMVDPFGFGEVDF